VIAERLARKHAGNDIEQVMAPRFSLVIPAHNEEAFLPRLLDSVEEAKERYHGEGAIEVLVVDNRSTDSTAEIASRRGCIVLHEEKRVIAAVRNRGARAARGDLLSFTDADAAIHPETFNVIDRAMLSGKYVAGATGVRLERMSPGIAAAYVMMMPMVWTTGMDTGVVFCRREDFLAVGGYNENRLFAEDVQFLMDMRRLGRPRGQRLARLTSAKSIASTRKFDKYGDWHYAAMLFRFGFWYLFAPHRMNEFARGYWYDGR
jgi:glycosyltransferase involved in cell wall biosynthesis